jgi:hypothetical protein
MTDFKLIQLDKGSKKNQNYEISHIWKVMYIIFTFHTILMCFFYFNLIFC